MSFDDDNDEFFDAVEALPTPTYHFSEGEKPTSLLSTVYNLHYLLLPCLILLFFCPNRLMGAVSALLTWFRYIHWCTSLIETLIISPDKLVARYSQHVNGFSYPSCYCIFSCVMLHMCFAGMVLLIDKAPPWRSFTLIPSTTAKVIEKQLQSHFKSNKVSVKHSTSTNQSLHRLALI